MLSPAAGPQHRQRRRRRQVPGDLTASSERDENNNSNIKHIQGEEQEQEGDEDEDAEEEEENLTSSSAASQSEGDEEGAESGEQVITSLQVNSKKVLPEGAECGSSAAPAGRQEAERPSRGPRKRVGDGLERPAAGAAHLAEAQLSGAPKARQKLVLDPAGQLYYHWSMVVSLAFLYNFWAISYRFSFQEINLDSMGFWFALDYTADLIYVLDVVVNLRTGYLEEGVLQRNIAKIGQHYCERTRFYLDCFCLLPLDTLYLSFGFSSILRFPRLVKIYKFWSYTDRTERHTNYPNVYRTFTLVHYILVIFHWNACLFHMISKNKIIDIENLYKIDGNQCSDILCQYLHAFYWSTLALTTVGDLPRPRTRGEYLYVTAELFFGLFLFASVLGHVANIVTNVSAARKEFQAKLDAVKTFMRMRRVSDELQSKVIRWFDYLWSSQQNSDEERSVACLPDRLKAELAIHVHLDTLKRVDIFQNTEAGFLCELVLRLKPVLFSPGDYVCRKHEVGHEMYIVSRGILEVVTNEGKRVVATLKAGSYFGEISVLNVGKAGNKRTASVRSVGYSDLFCLNKQDLWDVLKNYPNAEARIRARAEERLSKLGHPSAGAGAVAGQPQSRATKKWRSSHALQQQPPRWAPQQVGSNSCLNCSFVQQTAHKAKGENLGFVRPNGEGALAGHRRRVCSSASCYQVALAAHSARQAQVCAAATLDCCCLVDYTAHSCYRPPLPTTTVQTAPESQLPGGHPYLAAAAASGTDEGWPCCALGRQQHLAHQQLASVTRASSFRDQRQHHSRRQQLAGSKFSCSHSLQLPEVCAGQHLRRMSGSSQSRQATPSQARNDESSLLLSPVDSDHQERRAKLQSAPAARTGAASQQQLDHHSSTTTSSLPTNHSGRSSRHEQAASGPARSTRSDAQLADAAPTGGASIGQFRINMEEAAQQPSCAEEK